MKILYVTSEAAPYAASGGLGDVMGALPKSVVQNYPDAEVGVIVPLYNTLKEEHRLKLEKVIDLSFRFSWRNTGATVYKINNCGVNYYLVENHYYFDRPRLYGEYDDAERFAFFSMAVAEFMLKSGNIPDVVHANDALHKFRSGEITLYGKQFIRAVELHRQFPSSAEFPSR